MFLRHKQRAITAISRGGVLIPSRGIAGLLSNSHFVYGGSHWIITGDTVFAASQAVLTGIATISQAVKGVSDGGKIILTIDVQSITGGIAFSYAGVAGSDITATGVQDISVTAGTTNLVLFTSAAGEAIKFARITARFDTT